MLNPWLDRHRFASQLDRLVDPFALQGVTVVRANLPDLAGMSTLSPPPRDDLRRRIRTLNDVTRATADRPDAVLLDGWADPRTRRRAMFSIDRIHRSAGAPADRRERRRTARGDRSPSYASRGGGPTESGASI